MNTHGNALLDDISRLHLKDWVQVECRRRTEQPHEGIYIAGGSVVGQVFPDTYYSHRYGVGVLTLMLDGRPFIVMIDDIIDFEILKPGVRND